MVTLELFVTPDCISTQSAIDVAKEAVGKVPGSRLIVRSDRKERARAKSLGVFIYPSFVLEGEVFAVGQPKLERLVRAINDKARKLKGGKDGDDKAH
jgi:predicted DsbA family dithiol-disulfide isomerase